MKRIFLLASIFISVTASAQYVSSVGARGGLRGIGLTYKYYVAPKLFVNTDAIGTYSQELRGGDLVATINVRNKIHNANLQSKELTWSYGAGIHAGYYTDPNDSKENAMTFGPDLRLGAEYIFAEQWCFGADVTGFYNVMPLDKSDKTENKYDQFLGAGVFIRYIIQ